MLNILTVRNTENPILEDDAALPQIDHPPTAQWEHGRGWKISTNPGLVMTAGVIEAIFDIRCLTTVPRLCCKWAFEREIR